MLRSILKFASVSLLASMASQPLFAVEELPILIKEVHPPRQLMSRQPSIRCEAYRDRTVIRMTNGQNVTTEVIKPSIVTGDTSMLIRAAHLGQYSSENTVNLVKVIHSFKGNDAETMTLIQDHLNTSCAYTLPISTTYLIFARRDEKGQLHTHYCHGTKLSAEAKSDLEWLRQNGK